MKTARFWQPSENHAVKCGLCPHGCRIPEGGRSRCFGRVNHGGVLMAETWGRPAAMAVDPIEKKPLYHFLPGSQVLSLGTLGCNLACRFCQNWELSHPAERGRAAANPSVLPEEVARSAVQARIPSVAATYNEPAVWAEYALDIADACHALGVRMVAVTSGYFTSEASREFFAKMDAANVDLKSIRDDFYRNMCGAQLAPVLETLTHIRTETDCWLEVTTLLIPGLNDSEAEIDELTGWVAENLGEGTPLHFSAFHPAGELRDRVPTPAETVLRARARAKQNGLLHVYAGNLRGENDATSTWCPECGALLIEREGFGAKKVGMDGTGHCATCGTGIDGVWK